MQDNKLKAIDKNDALPVSSFLQHNPSKYFGAVNSLSINVNVTFDDHLKRDLKEKKSRNSSIFSENEKEIWANLKGSDIEKPQQDDRKLRAANKEKAKKNQRELAEAELEQWVSRWQRQTNLKFSPQQKRELRKWFECMDKDGSGEIGVEELAGPLLSTGIAHSIQEVKEIIRRVDKDHSGEIGFKEFLEVLQPPSKKKLRCACKHKHPAQTSEHHKDHHKPVQDQKEAVPSGTPKHDDQITELSTLLNGAISAGMRVDVLATLQRRRQLMAAIVDEAQRREDTLPALNLQIDDARSKHDYRKLEKLKQQAAAIEDEKESKQKYVQAVQSYLRHDIREVIREDSRERNAKAQVHKVRGFRTRKPFLPALESVNLSYDSEECTEPEREDKFPEINQPQSTSWYTRIKKQTSLH